VGLRHRRAAHQRRHDQQQCCPAGGTLSDNVSGWVDYLDINGCLLGGGSTAPNRTIYIRRWSVEPLPTNPNNTLVLQVLVTRRVDRGAADDGNVMRMPEEARVMSIKTRKYK
jgi:hypothetical protein